MENYETHDLTSISFNPVVPAPPERRAETRQTTLLRIGKLITARDERLCMIRNISSAGAMLRLYQPIGVGEEIRMEITPDCPVAATVLWTQDDLAGVEFAEPIDVVAALNGGDQAGPYRRVSRMPRLQIRYPAQLCTDDLEWPVTLCDLSLHGAKIETATRIETDTEAALFVDGLPPLSGRVRWWRDNRAGLEFDIPVQMDVLAGWIGSAAEQDCAEAVA